MRQVTTGAHVQIPRGKYKDPEQAFDEAEQSVRMRMDPRGVIVAARRSKATGLNGDTIYAVECDIQFPTPEIS